VPKQEYIDRLVTALGGADRLWQQSAARVRPGELSCRSGCFGCCIGLFAIGLPEALAVRRAVEELPGPERDALRARAARAVERTAGTFPGDPSMGVLDPERTEEAEEAWLREARPTPCPALELPSGRCAVYAARPTTCRTYGLALRAEGETLIPACELNFGGASPERVLETGIDAARLAAVDQKLVEIAFRAGLPAGVETTIAHAVAGSAFPPLDGSL
jgi:Fe-S-cluster containining protein